MHPFFVFRQDFDRKCVIYKVCTIVHFFNQEKFIKLFGIKQVLAV